MTKGVVTPPSFEGTKLSLWNISTTKEKKSEWKQLDMTGDAPWGPYEVSLGKTPTTQWYIFGVHTDKMFMSLMEHSHLITEVHKYTYPSLDYTIFHKIKPSLIYPR